MKNSLKKFVYVAKDLNGNKIKGTYIADDQQYVVDSLTKRNLFVEKIKTVSGKAPSAFFTVSGRVSLKEITNFCKQFSVLISSGISIIDAILTLKEQQFSSLLRKTLEKVEDDLYEGMMLSESMKKYPKVFPDFLASMVYVGETSGKLSEVLISVADYYTRQQKNRQKLRSALAYPTVLFFMMIAVLVAMLYFVIPSFVSSLSAMEVELPGITKFLFKMSAFFKSNWQNVALAIVILIGIIYLIGRTQKGRYFYDMCKVKIPIAKNINMSIFTAQFVESLGLLLSSGIDIVSALENIRAIIKNKYLGRQFDKVILDVKKGIPLSNAIEIEMQLSSIVTQMIAVGEKTGQTDKMLLGTTDYFDQQVSNSLSLVTSIIQPVLLSIMGLFLAVMFIAIYAPILSMISSISV